VNILHWLAHQLDLHSTFKDMYADNGYVYSGTRCNTCGKVERVIKMWPVEESDKLLKNLAGR
jgi:hypothetical protein